MAEVAAWWPCADGADGKPIQWAGSVRVVSGQYAGRNGRIGGRMKAANGLFLLVVFLGRDGKPDKATPQDLVRADRCLSLG